MGLRWGSTSPGELFTGSSAWRAEVRGELLALRVGGRSELVVHLVQMERVEVTTGIMWATCQFTTLAGSEKQSYTVDGIPNEQAKAMKLAVDDAVTAQLASFVQKNTRSIEEWLDRVHFALSPVADVFVSDDLIGQAFANVTSPPTPGAIPWDAILTHPLAASARKLAGSWPNWVGSPIDEVRRRVRAHNEGAFAASLKRWNARISAALGTDRWIPKSVIGKAISKYPAPAWPGKTWAGVVGDISPEVTVRKLADKRNAEHLAKQCAAKKKFFETVEKNPLTDEQMHACICMDDSVMIVAAAGSGKTSTMVAKTGYVLEANLATPDQILLLAFNRATADEVGKRVSEQLVHVLNVERVQSKTFHSFGIDVIAAATGKKPTLAKWVQPDNPGGDVREVADIIESLSLEDAGFKRDFELFRTIYGRDIGKWGEPQEYEHYGEGRRGFLTANGDIVKSKEERVLADWLFYNGVHYEYERAYEHDTADQQHRQYFPDFYYPEANLYHEHFALNAKGEAPKHFKDYLEGVEWKRRIHAEKATALFETTSHGLSTGEAIKSLEIELVRRGVRIDFDPRREAIGLPPVTNQELARSFRVFQQHVKNNGLTHRQLQAALAAQSTDGFAARLRMFLALYERISVEWERRLKTSRSIDFEDMLLLAAGHVESGKFNSPFTIILADEFQDSSRARIRLLKALAKNPSVQTHLCVVGDDWQGINRFAGSDISVMTEFERSFEHATRLTLNTTFRCPQHLCDVSSQFIQANPTQIAKKVQTTNPLTKTPLLAFGFQREESIPELIQSQLEAMHAAVVAGKLRPAKGDHVTVMFIGRYRDDVPTALEKWQRRFGDRLKIAFYTAHGSKGLEAEYVFVLNVVQGTRGFPSQIQDDPALQLAMPAPDPFPFAEERRLFYVAMTRARKQVRFYTTLGQPSQFLVELIKNQHLTIEPVDGEPFEACPRCGTGVLQDRDGRRGVFLGCSRFPACDFTRKLRGGAKRVSPARPALKAHRIRTPVDAGAPCPICQRGTLQTRNGKNGLFLGCSEYPRCRATAPISMSPSATPPRRS